jgi:hypothetical protein
MGLGFRVFFVGENDSIKRISFAKFDRLCNQDPKEQLPEYANKRIKYALAILEVQGRTPLSVIKIECCYLSFNSEGRLESTFLEDEMQTGLAGMPALSLNDEPTNIIDAQHKFAIKKFKHQFTWELNQKIEREIYDLIFT